MMTIHISRQIIAAVFVSVVWIISMLDVVHHVTMGRDFSERLLFLSFFCAFVTFVVFSVSQIRSLDRNVRRNRIEKVLSQLEDDDLELLRERLIYQEAEMTEYETEAFMQKRKR
jgi:hypothetical protein